MSRLAAIAILGAALFGGIALGLLRTSGSEGRLAPDEVHLDLLARAPRVTSPSGRATEESILLVQPVPYARRVLTERQDPDRGFAHAFVPTDMRRAWTTDDDTVIEIDLPEGVEGTFTVELGVSAARGEQSPPGSAMEFEARLVGGSTERPLFSTLVDLTRMEPRLWRTQRVELSTKEVSAPRLVLANRLVGTSWTTKRACWANPAILRAERGRKAPNVILLSVDTLRADHLSCYGYHRTTTPRIDALLAKGALFERAISAAPWTLPSYGSLFTGRMPNAHRAGMVSAREGTWGTEESSRELSPERAALPQSAEALAGGLKTLAEALREQGYRSAGFVNNPYVHAVRGLARGFGQYTSYRWTADEGIDLALEWIAEQQSAPFFLFLHLIDPHAPYAPPSPFDRTYSARSLEDIEDYPATRDQMAALAPGHPLRIALVDMYDAEIRYTDSAIGRFLDVIEEQGLFSDTIFVLHSDHGEEFWEHGGVGHGHDLWDELLHVPLGIVYPSAVPAGVRVERRVRTIDVFPTLLDLLGLDPRSYGFDVSDGASAVVGRSLVPCIDGGGRVEDRVAMAEALLYGPPVDRWQEAKALYVGDLKLIAGGLSATDRLFDLSRDPHENENVAAELRTEASELRARLTRNRDYTTPSTESSSGVRIDPVMKQELSDLGYVGTGTQEDGADPEDP